MRKSLILCSMLYALCSGTAVAQPQVIRDYPDIPTTPSSAQARKVQSYEAQEPESVDSPPPEAVKVNGGEVEMPDFDNEDKWTPYLVANLQGLNKVTAKTSEIKIKAGEKSKFGNLDITIKKCFKKPNSEKNESVVLMEIWDEIPGQTRNKSFYGWMFSSSPSISALEHPIYDVILLECVGTGAKKKADESKKQ